LQASRQLNLQYNVVGMEIWNLKGYLNWNETKPNAKPTLQWISSNREKYFADKTAFDDLIFLTYESSVVFFVKFSNYRGCGSWGSGILTSSENM